MDLKDRVSEYIKEYEMIFPGECVVAGLSGGADSVCMLLILNDLSAELGFSLIAAHIEHNIRGREGLEDALFVKELCDGLDIPLYTYHEDVPARSDEARRSLEEAARDARIECFEDACKKSGAEKVALAHHARDLAETVIFNMIRGSALSGLGGIRPVSEMREYTVIRPLLSVKKQDIEEYLAKRGQSYRTDSTNLDTRIARNRIRLNVLPQLEEINDRAIEHIMQCAGAAAEASEYIEYEAMKAALSCVLYDDDDEGSRTIKLDRERFLEIDPLLQKTIIHDLISKAAGGSRDITMENVISVIELMARETGAQLSLPRNVKAYNEYGCLIIKNCTGGRSKGDEADAAETCADVSGCVRYGELTISCDIFEYVPGSKIPRGPCTKWFDYDNIKSGLRIRKRREGDFLQVTREGGRKKLKDLFIDEKIPRSRRDETVLIADGSHIVWAVGLRISEAYKVTETTKRVISISIREGKSADE